jgi:DNA-binding transcriptional ArsR family regulator
MNSDASSRSVRLRIFTILNSHALPKFLPSLGSEEETSSWRAAVRRLSTVCSVRQQADRGARSYDLAAPQKWAVTQFAVQLNMSEPAVSKHVRVLVDAALLTKTRDGRYRWCRLIRSAFGPARESIEELCEAVPLISRQRDAGPQVKRNRFRSLKNIVRWSRTQSSRRQKEPN